LSRRDDQVEPFGGQRDELQIAGEGGWLARDPRIGQSGRDRRSDPQVPVRVGVVAG
jgi:hypothetical protein